MEMLLVKCVDAKNSRALREGETYYAFPFLNKTAAYISRFPNVESNTGAFQLSRFEIVVEMEVNTEPTAEDTTPVATPSIEVEVYHYAYRLQQYNRSYSTYGFALTNELLALFKDAALTQFIGTTKVGDCEVLKSLNRTFDSSGFSTCPRTISFADLEGVPLISEATSNIPVAEEQAELVDPVEKVVFEQLALF